MKKILSMLMMASTTGPNVFAALEPSQVTDGRTFKIVYESNRNIQNYLRGHAEASPELFVEILNFLNEMDSRPSDVNPKATELFLLAEEVGSHLDGLDTETHARLEPVMKSLLAQYPARGKNEILLRLYDRFWFWSPDDLNHMARRVRGDNLATVSTQLMWILENATQEQRQNFFAQIPFRQVNRNLRWFMYALANKYGYPVDLRKLKRALSDANPIRLKPAPLPINLSGTDLPTSQDLHMQAVMLTFPDTVTDKCEAYLSELFPQPN
jgi:hypothetical protein